MTSAQQPSSPAAQLPSLLAPARPAVSPGSSGGTAAASLPMTRTIWCALKPAMAMASAASARSCGENRGGRRDNVRVSEASKGEHSCPVPL